MRRQRNSSGRCKHLPYALLDVHIQSGIRDVAITTTPEHPFYVPIAGDYIAAGRLAEGLSLRTPVGVASIAKAGALRSEATKVYNIEVAEGHNYFVSEARAG